MGLARFGAATDVALTPQAINYLFWTSEEVPVSPSEARQEAETSSPGSTALRRALVYVVAGLALFVVLWSLINGADRDLRSVPDAALMFVSQKLGGA